MACLFNLKAAVDLAAESLQLGYFRSALDFGAGIAVETLCHYVRKVNAIVALRHRTFKVNVIQVFWVAYILTGPLGASFGDFLSQPVSNGGPGLGTLGNGALFLTMVLRPITYMSVMQRNASAVHEMHPAS